MAGDPTKAAFDSRFAGDRVFHIVEGTSGSIANGDSTSKEEGYRDYYEEPSTTDQPWWVGIWSMDGGTTWNPMAFGYAVGNNLTAIIVYAVVSTGATRFMTINFVNNSGSTKTFLYKVAFIVPPDAGFGISPRFNPSPTVSNIDKQLDSRIQTLRVFEEFREPESTVIPDGQSHTYTVTHNLGYAPMARGFVNYPDYLQIYDMDTPTNVRCHIESTPTVVRFVAENDTGGPEEVQLHGRVYYD